MKTAVIYCRVSTKEQTQNHSLPVQEKTCREWCDKNAYRVACIFREEGESAKTINRTEFQKMMAFCLGDKKAGVSAIVVYDLSRFARDVESAKLVEGQFKKRGIDVVAVTQNTENNAAGKLQRNILLSFAQYDNDQRAEKTTAGMKAALQMGRWPFKAPLGYQNFLHPVKGKTIIQDPERAPLVRQAFELYSTGIYTKEQVLKTVTEHGLKTQTGKKLSAQTFNKLLRNPIYAGLLKVNNWESAKGDFDAIIPLEIFEKAQALISGKKASLTPHNRNRDDFPLRHFTICETCGRPLTASWSKGRKRLYPYYFCQNSKCRGVSIRKDRLEESFSQYLAGLKLTPDALRLFNAILRDSWEEKTKGQHIRAKQLQSKIEALKERKSKLLSALLDKVVDEATYREEATKLDSDITLNETAIEEHPGEILDFEGLLNNASSLISNQDKLWKRIGLNARQRLQKVLFPTGLKINREGIGTAQNPCSYLALCYSNTSKEILVAPRGIEPRFSG